MVEGTITSDFEMLKTHLLHILQAHEGMRVHSPRAKGDKEKDDQVLLPRAALKVLDAAEEYRKGVEYFDRVVQVVEKMDNYEMMVSGTLDDRGWLSGKWKGHDCPTVGPKKLGKHISKDIRFDLCQL